MITPRRAWCLHHDLKTVSAPLQANNAYDNFFNAHWHHGLWFASPTTRLLLPVAVGGFILFDGWNLQGKDAVEFGNDPRSVSPAPRLSIAGRNKHRMGIRKNLPGQDDRVSGSLFS